MKLNPEYSTNEGRKQTIAHDADGKPYIKVISAFGIATAYDMGGNLVSRWEASKEEIDEYNAAPEYTEEPATEEPAQTESKEEEEEMTTLEKIAADMQTHYTDRSAWSRGVATIAADLLDEYANNYGKNAAAPTMADLLNGADNWSQYSWGGCYLVYDADIAELLCTPSELKRTRNGERRPNGREEWLDVQARALNQAARRIISSARRVCKEV